MVLNNDDNSYYGDSSANVQYNSNNNYDDGNYEYSAGSGSGSDSESSPNYASEKIHGKQLTWMFVIGGLIAASTAFAFIAYKSVSRSYVVGRSLVVYHSVLCCVT